MPHIRLELEGFPTKDAGPAEVLERALAKMATPLGPTYLVLEAGEDGYCQAAGTNGRYLVELRERYGEGFRHWRVATSEARTEARTTVLINQRCPHGKHPPRGCPVRVGVNQVLGFEDASEVLRFFHRSRSRDDKRFWHDVSEELRGRDGDSDGEIRSIRPSRRAGAPSLRLLWQPPWQPYRSRRTRAGDAPAPAQRLGYGP